MAKFLGLTLGPKSAISRHVCANVHISSVALDDGNHGKLYVTVHGQKYLIGTLNKRTSQLALDLNFNAGDHFKFENSGSGKLSILGYHYPPYISSSDSVSGSSSGSETESTVSADDARTNSDWEDENQAQGYGPPNGDIELDADPRAREQDLEDEYKDDEDDIEEIHNRSLKRRYIE